jgi:type VI secretion system protein ImpH
MLTTQSIISTTTTSEQLLERVYAVSFCQLLRCIQIEHRTRIGMVRELDKQPLQLIASLDSSFAANEIVEWIPAEPRSKLSVSFFGLFGPSGALPEHYTQTIIERVRDKDYTLREFLDIFNHRLLSLFYRSWEKHSFPVAFETAAASHEEDTMTHALWGLIGHRLSASRDKMSVNDECFLYYGGQFSSSRPSLESLRACVQDFTGDRTMVEPLVGQWLTLDEADQSRMGNPPAGMSMGSQLGLDTIAGQRVWDVENRFRVCLGPVNWETLESYLPMNTRLRKLTDFVRRYVGPQFDFDFQVLLSRTEVHGVQLSDGGSFCLGWNTWLGEWNSVKDAEEAVFELPDFA